MSGNSSCKLSNSEADLSNRMQVLSKARQLESLSSHAWVITQYWVIGFAKSSSQRLKVLL